MSGQMMTLLGAFGAMITFILVGLPAEAPLLIRLSLGAINAGLVFYLGQTNKGTTPPPEQKVAVTFTQPPKP